MSLYLQFLVLGLGAGAFYAALANGLVTAYKATGIINFAQGAFATWGAYTYCALRNDGKFVFLVGTFDVGSPMSAAPAFVIGVGMSIVITLLSHFLVFRPLRRSPVMAQVVASVGLMISIQALVVLRFGPNTVKVPSVLPQTTWGVGGAQLSIQGLLLAVLVIVLAVAVWAYFRFARMGVATRAGAENERAAVLMGYAPDRLATVAWIISGAVCGGVAILAAPVTGLNPTNLVLAVVPALAVALIGRLESLAAVTIGGLALGSFQALITLLTSKSWWPSWASVGVQDAVPFVVVIVALTVFGGRLPARGSLGGVGLPAVRIPRLRLRSVLVLTAIGLALVLFTSGSYRFGVVTSMILAIISLSLVLLTGYLGQISLAQAAFAGAAGFALSKFTTNWGVPFPLSILLSSLVATALGIVIALPALRIRGAQLAVVTLAAGVAIQSFVFNNPKLTPLTGNLIKEPTLFGLNVSIREGRDLVRTTFAIMVLIVLGIVLLFFVRLASGSTGRAFLAVRANERAAASAGIDVRRAKILGFAIASFLAGVGGCLLGYSRGQLSAESFTVAVSLSLLAVSYLGGITSIAGALVAGLLGPLGLVYTFFDRTLSMGKYYALVSGLGLVLTAVMNPVGIAGATEENFRQLKKRFSPRSHGPPAEIAPGAAPVPQAALAGSEGGHDR